MTTEPSARRAEFVSGSLVRLADGELWSLPLRNPRVLDEEYDGLLRAMCEAEDAAEWLRAGLALTILLLTRNYDLSPAELTSLLTFDPNDPALADLQADIGRIADASIASLRISTPSPDAGGAGPTTPRTLRGIRSLWTP